MIRARGTLGAASHSASVIGLASGSVIAATWTSSSVMASAWLQSKLAAFVVVSASFMGFGFPRGDDANPVFPQGVGNEQKSVFDHTEPGIPLLGVLMPAIDTRHRERIPERRTGHLERNVMIPRVDGSFDVIPFEFVILHKVMATISFANLSTNHLSADQCRFRGCAAGWHGPWRTER